MGGGGLAAGEVGRGLPVGDGYIEELRDDWSLGIVVCGTEASQYLLALLQIHIASK